MLRKWVAKFELGCELVCEHIFPRSRVYWAFHSRTIKADAVSNANAHINQDALSYCIVAIVSCPASCAACEESQKWRMEYRAFLSIYIKPNSFHIQDNSERRTTEILLCPQNLHRTLHNHHGHCLHCRTINSGRHVHSRSPTRTLTPRLLRIHRRRRRPFPRHPYHHLTCQTGVGKVVMMGLEIHDL